MPVEVILSSFVVAVVLPLAVYSLWNGSPPPDNTRLTKYYLAEKNLMFAGNLFLLAICANAAGRLGQHFGFLAPDPNDILMFGVAVPFLVLLAVYLAFWVRAVNKVRRARDGDVPGGAA